jgi:hypothetical protein
MAADPSFVVGIIGQFIVTASSPGASRSGSTQFPPFLQPDRSPRASILSLHQPTSFSIPHPDGFVFCSLFAGNVISILVFTSPM